MLERLQAEESLLAFQRTATGSATMEKDAAGKVLREWERSASDAPLPVAKKATPEELRAMGIGVRRVSKADLPVVGTP